MKIIPCIAVAGSFDPENLHCGEQMEIGQVPRIGEKIVMKMNLFDHIFKGVNSSYTKGILFTNAITHGVVKDVVHRFITVERPLTRLFPSDKMNEIYHSLTSEEDFDLIHVVYVVIHFQKAE